MAEEREAKVRLDVERGGEPEAFAEAAGDARTFREILDQLRDAGVDVSGLEETQAQFEALDQSIDELLVDIESAATGIEGVAEGAAGAAGEMATGVEAASTAATGLGSAAGESYPRVNSLKDVVKLLGTESQLTATIVKGSFIAGLLALASETNGKLVDALNTATQALGAEGEQFRLVGGILPIYQGGIDGVAQALADFVGDADLAAQATDVTSDAADRARERWLAARQPVLDAAAAYKEFVASLGPTAAELDKAGTALAQNIQKFVEGNQQLGQQQFADLFKKQIQEVLDSAARLGVEPPRAIQQLADAWAILPTAAEDAAARHKHVVDQIRADLTGASEATRQELEAMAAALPEALAGLDLPTLQFVDPAQFEAAKAKVDELVGKFRSAGVAIPEALASVANSVGVLVSGFEVAIPKAGELAGAAVQLTTTFDEAGNKIQSMTTAVDGATAATESNATATGAAATSTVQWVEATNGAVGTITNIGTAATQTATALQAAGAAGETAAGGLAAPGEEAAGAAAEIGPLASHTQVLGEAAQVAATALGQEATALAGLPEPAAQAATSVNDLVTAVQALAESQFASAVVAQLQEITQEAAAATAAIQAVHAAAAGGGAAAPPGPQVA